MLRIVQDREPGRKSHSHILGASLVETNF